MDDTEIIKSVQTGNSESFSLIVDRYHRQLLNFTYRLLGDSQIVEDIGQEVFLLEQLPEPYKQTIITEGIHYWPYFWPP